MLYITVHLYSREGLHKEFKEYEQKVLNLFRQHGGEVIVAYVPARLVENAEVPNEIQILRIANQLAYKKFMNDPVRIAMANERTALIRKTESFLSDQLIDY